jgi:lysophospholipase L1-like esterase
LDSNAFDLHGKVPYHNATEEFRKKIWDDGLHLTAEGYKLVGEVVGGHLIALLKDRGL